jgi:glycerol-3-phosphate acyltransferase PlsY
MMGILALLAAALSAYIVGSFPTSYLLTRAIKGTDIRTSGSGNAGATNVLRTVGKLPALVTLLIDMFKGAFAVLISGNFFYGYGVSLDYNFYRGLLALIVVSGHIWPVFLNFKGGKGVATAIGVGFVLAPNALWPALAIWIAVFMLSKYVSLASIISLVSFPIMAALMNTPLYIVLFSIAICGISIFRHKENIERLVNGRENKIRISKS